MRNKINEIMFIKHLFLNPIRFISSYVIKTHVTKFGVPSVAISLINVLYHTSYGLISNVGIYPVYRCLRDIGKFFQLNPTIDSAASINALKSYLSQSNSPYVVNTFIHKLAPILYQCFPVTSGLLTIYQIFILGIFTTFIKPIIKYILKFLLGLVISAIAIIWNDYLSSLGYLKDFSYLIIDFVETHSNFKIPKFGNELNSKIINTIPSAEDTSPFIEITKPVSETTTPISNIDNTNSTHNLTNSDLSQSDLNKTSYYLTVVGLVCLGLVTAVGVIIVADIYAHDTVNNIPVINTIADSINNLWNASSAVNPKIEPDLSNTTTNQSPVITVKTETDLPTVKTELSSPTVTEQPDLSSPKYIRNSYLQHDLPEQISRSTSSDSYTSSNYNKYFKEGNITPPISRPSTPINQDE